MRALSLWPPWASLIAAGKKTVETRKWGTMFRGDVAIHQTANWPKGVKELCDEAAFQDALEAIGLADLAKVPLGRVLCVVELFDCVRTDDEEKWKGRVPEADVPFGDFRPNRYVWFLRNLRVLENPPRAVGHQLFWEWDPKGYESQVQVQETK